MKNAPKWILRSLLALAVLILLLVVALYLSLDGLVRAGVERGANHATGQAASLDHAAVSISNGTVQLTGLDIDNPPAYGKSKLLTMKDCKIAATLSSLLSSTVQVPEIDIDGLELTLEQNGLKTNLADVLAVSQSQTPAAGGASAPTSPGKTLNVGLIKLTNTKVHVHGLITADLDLGPITIDQPTNPDGRPLKIADVVAKILLHVAQQIAQNPQIPEALRGTLTQAQGVVSDVTKVLQDKNTPLDQKAKSLTNDFNNLLNHKKKDSPK